MTDQMPQKKIFTVSTLITVLIVAMLIISGPAQAVQVAVNAEGIDDLQTGDVGFLYVNVTIGANERIPLANISLEGLPYIPGSPGGVLVFNVSDFNSVGDSITKGSYSIQLMSRYGWIKGYGYGYGYADNEESAPYYGYGYSSRFYGYGYGYGYGDTDTYTQLKYKVTVNTTGARSGDYDVLVKANTGQDVVFEGSAVFRLIDNSPPAGVDALHNVSYEPTYINWTWSDPADPDFSHVQVYIDGTSAGDVAKGVQFYKASGFAPDTEHTIATRTVDVNGNINQTWVSNTARTAPRSLIHIRMEITPDTFHPKSRSIVMVTIYNNVPEGFDIEDINISSLRLGRGGARVIKELPGSGKRLRLFFNAEDTGIRCGDTSIYLIGKTYSGQVIVDSDSIKTVGCRDNGRDGDSNSRDGAGSDGGGGDGGKH